MAKSLEKGKTGWHMNQVSPLLPQYWLQLNLASGDVVLVPLYGKSLDMQWSAEEDYKVIGIEVAEKLSEGLKSYFDENTLPYETDE